MQELSWPVIAPHVEPVTVTEADLDGFGHTNNVVYLRWLEQAAWAHSQALGLTLADYRRLGAGLVVRRHELEYLLPSFLGDELLIGTWISGNDGKLQAARSYQIQRPRDGRTVLRAHTRWVCVDMESGRPRRMPREFVEAYRPAEPSR